MSQRTVLTWVGDLLRREQFIVAAAHWTTHECYTVASHGTVYAVWVNATKQWFYYTPPTARGLPVVVQAALLLSPTAKQLDTTSMGALLMDGYAGLVERRMGR